MDIFYIDNNNNNNRSYLLNPSMCKQQSKLFACVNWMIGGQQELRLRELKRLTSISSWGCLLCSSETVLSSFKENYRASV